MNIFELLTVVLGLLSGYGVSLMMPKFLGITGACLGWGLGIASFIMLYNLFRKHF